MSTGPECNPRAIEAWKNSSSQVIHLLNVRLACVLARRPEA
jgi:hypothetical protein